MAKIDAELAKFNLAAPNKEPSWDLKNKNDKLDTKDIDAEMAKIDAELSKVKKQDDKKSRTEKDK